jgi:FkbM family methyltransferase
MTFISYAQNFEDVMLWRALKHIEKGFYIDVGACSPDVESVTRAFYEHGWRGINVEPNPEFHAQLVTRRTRDINVSIALSDKPGTSIMNFFRNLGLSTLDENIARKHANSGFLVDKQEVEITTLSALWKQYVPEGQDVHFLKVDVEGVEEAVLQGNDWSKYRPWIIVVEATLPMSQQESHEAWEPILLTASYFFAYADGLNRFYVAREHAELMTAFKYPHNIFDNFKLNAQHEAEARAEEAEARAEVTSTALTVERGRAQWLESQIQAIHASRSWRITHPLRSAFTVLVQIRAMFSNIQLIVKLQINNSLSRILARLILFMLAHPMLKRGALNLLRIYPPLEAWLYRFAAAKGIIPGGRMTHISSKVPLKLSEELLKLTPSARCIYADLKTAMERQKKGG